MKCPKCNKESDRYNGRVCADCKRKYQREYYRKRKQDPEWLAKERERTRRRNRRLGYHEKYKAIRTEKQKARLIEINREWRRRNPKAYKAHCLLNNAIRENKITKGVCAVCGSKKVEGHHNDYSKPLEVTWLCRKHHAEIHRK